MSHFLEHKLSLFSLEDDQLWSWSDQLLTHRLAQRPKTLWLLALDSGLFSVTHFCLLTLTPTMTPDTRSITPDTLTWYSSAWYTISWHTDSHNDSWHEDSWHWLRTLQCATLYLDALSPDTLTPTMTPDAGTLDSGLLSDTLSLDTLSWHTDSHSDSWC